MSQVYPSNLVGRTSTYLPGRYMNVGSGVQGLSFSGFNKSLSREASENCPPRIHFVGAI